MEDAVLLFTYACNWTQWTSTFEFILLVERRLEKEKVIYSGAESQFLFLPIVKLGGKKDNLSLRLLSLSLRPILSSLPSPLGTRVTILFMLNLAGREIDKLSSLGLIYWEFSFFYH